MLSIEGVDESMADPVFRGQGYQLAAGAGRHGWPGAMTVEDLTVIRAIDEQFAEYLIHSASKISGVVPGSVAAEEDSGSHRSGRTRRPVIRMRPMTRQKMVDGSGRGRPSRRPSDGG